jgi:hypothetical protein
MRRTTSPHRSRVESVVMKTLLLLFVGFALGLASAAAAYAYLETRKVAYILKQPLDIQFSEAASRQCSLPAGTVLYHDSVFAEGFDRLKLYVNAADREVFEVKRLRYTQPYWLTQKYVP